MLVVAGPRAAAPIVSLVLLAVLLATSVAPAVLRLLRERNEARLRRGWSRKGDE